MAKRMRVVIEKQPGVTVAGETSAATLTGSFRSPLVDLVDIVDAKTGEVLGGLGCRLKDFRGEEHRLLNVSRLPYPGKSAKLVTASGEFYASVFGVEVRLRRALFVAKVKATEKGKGRPGEHAYWSDLLQLADDLDAAKAAAAEGAKLYEEFAKVYEE